MHFTDTGTGAPLVLLHAYPLDSRMWDRVRAPLAVRNRVITVDQRGLGRSSLPAGAPHLATAAADVLRLLDSLGVRRALLGGCSMGGYLAMALLRLAPERVAGLLLVDTRAVADTPAAAAGRRAVADRADAEGTGDWLAEAMLPVLLADRGRRVHGPWVRELVESQSAAGVAWAQRAMAARVDSTELLRHSRIPALVVSGADDTLIPPAVSRAMASAMGAEFTLVPGAGHLPPVEAPERFLAAVHPWLTRVR